MAFVRKRDPINFSKATALAALSILLSGALTGTAGAGKLADLPRLLANAKCDTLLYPIPDWIKDIEAQCKTNPVLKKRVESLTHYFVTGKSDVGGIEAELAFTLRDLRDEGLLKPVLAKALSEARKNPKFPAIPGNDSEIVAQFYGLIDAELISRGLSPLGMEGAFKPWTDLAAEQAKIIESSGKSKIGDANFLTELSNVARADFIAGHEIKILNEAPEAVSERERMINGAQKSIHVMTWALYGDEAGEHFANLLIKRHNDGIDVKIMVDGQTADRVGYRESIAKLRAAGVPVIEWRSKKNPYFGQHRKFLVVDAELGTGEALAGGRNFGNDYLHMGTKPDSPKWRDTDIVYSGPGVRKNARRFADLWNEQLDRLAADDTEHAQKYHDLKIDKKKARTEQRVKNAKGPIMAILDHTPNAAGYDPIYLALLKSIEASTKSIDISNAYVILTPGIKDALVRARARGVKVRIFTNSARSVDEPIVSIPILHSLAELLPYGVEIFVKQGDTLHSKFAIFDDELLFVMSYNLHPRSLRYEGESANVIFHKETALTMREAYEKDLAAAKPVKVAADLEIPANPLSDVAEKEFRDQL